MMDNIEKMTDHSGDNVPDYTETPQSEIQIVEEEILNYETDANLLLEEFIEEEKNPLGDLRSSSFSDTSENNPLSNNARNIEEIMLQGLSFFNSLIKLGTGKEIILSKESLSIDPESGEVIFKFKLPEKS